MKQILNVLQRWILKKSALKNCNINKSLKKVLALYLYIFFLKIEVIFSCNDKYSESHENQAFAYKNQ
jgi:hypothetical protein